MENENINLSGNPIIEPETEPTTEPAAAQPQPSGRHAKKKMSTAKKILIVFAALAAVGLIISGILFADYLGLSLEKASEVTIVVPKGASTAEIAEMLEDADIIEYPIFFRIYTRVKGYDGLYQYGTYTFGTRDGYSALAKVLMSQGEREKTAKVTIRERASVDDIAKALEKGGVCTADDFYAALTQKTYDYDFLDGIPADEVHYLFEGYLFPDTYDFYAYDSKECAVLAVDKMLGEMDKVLREENAYEKAEAMGYSIHEIITMASIVELEASGQPTEMANVAQVFYNRLENWDNPLLGSSPTRKYPYGNGSYDTNTEPGLPPGPYCSPSLNAIRAALNPNSDLEATYFVTDASMKFYYTYSYSEHINIINKLKADKNWIYETY